MRRTFLLLSLLFASVLDKYLVVKPEIVGPNFREFTKLYNEIFAIGK